MHCIKYWSVALRKNRKDIINKKDTKDNEKGGGIHEPVIY